jgi:hypothetical protein
MVNVPLDQGVARAADPDLAGLVRRDRDSPVPSDHGALANDVRRRKMSLRGQPEGEAGVEAARDRVLRDGEPGAERAHLVVGPDDAPVALVVGSDDPDLETVHGGEVGS